MGKKTYRLINKWRTIIMIARRYFYAKKSTNAVNIITGISVACILVVGLAMVVLFSVFNGFEEFTTQQFRTLSPDLVIEHEKGQTFKVDAPLVACINETAGVDTYALSLTEQALLVNGEDKTIAKLHGVDEQFLKVTMLQDLMFEGEFELEHDSIPQLVIGIGLGAKLSAGAGYIEPVSIFMPKRVGRVSTVRPDKNFLHQELMVSGVFRTDEEEDQSDAYLPIETLREMLFYNGNYADQILIKLEEDIPYTRVEKSLERSLPEGFKVKNRFEQHADVYKVLKTEKWITYAILVFVLILSIFSIVSTLGMLIIEKRKDTQTIRFLGAERWMTRSIIIVEGWLLSLIGGVVGIVLGVLLVLLQAKYGFIKLATDNSGAFLLDAYPVQLRWPDLLISLGTILLVGYISSLIAFKVFGEKKAENSAYIH